MLQVNNLIVQVASLLGTWFLHGIKWKNNTNDKTSGWFRDLAPL